MNDDLAAAIDDDFPRARRELEDLIRIPSVSADGFDPGQVRRSAEAVAELFEDSGFTGVRLLEVDGAHPAVYGEMAGPPDAPTVLLYAHHDVQPPGPSDEWDDDPFEPVERDGRLYGRGSSDDKSGVVIHAASARAFKGKPPVTVKVFAEGEEEVGSLHVDDFMETYGDLLAADVVVVADLTNWRTGVPALTTSLRGLVDCIVEVRTLENAVHSGEFGGVVPDAISALARILATLHLDDGSVAIEGLVSGDADDLDVDTEAMLRRAGAVPGVELIGTGGINARRWRQPAVSVLAVDAPPISEAINQLVPVARAKVSMRLAPGQDPHAAVTALTDHLAAAAPWGVQVTITPGAMGRPFTASTDGAGGTAMRDALSAAYDSAVVEIGVGGSIPIVSAIHDAHPDADIVLVGVADHLSRAHGPNESLDLADLRSSILAEAIALRSLGA